MSTAGTRISPPDFPEQAAHLTARLRAAVAAALAAVPDLPGRRPIDLANGLGIDANLAWKVSRLVNDDEPFVSARHLPGPAAFDILLRALELAGVSNALAAAARAAFDGFKDLTRTHAGDRTSLRMLLDGEAQKFDARATVNHRRRAFEANSFIWGVQARVNFKLNVLAPSSDPASVDLASIRGFVDVRRIRPNVPWRLIQTTSTDRTGAVRTEFAREALCDAPGPPPDAGGLLLLPEFCSHPLPQCRQIQGPGGLREWELVEGAVGNIGVLTCVMGEIIRAIESRFRTEHLQQRVISSNMRMPSEWAVLDLVLHRALRTPGTTLDFTAYSDLFRSSMTASTYRDCDRLPVHERLEYLGDARTAPPASEIPKHAAMYRLIFERTAWDPADFDVYRLRMRFPPIPSNLRISHELPPRPGDAAGREG